MATKQLEKRVTWAELFFDLVFVFAVTQVSTLLHEHRGWLGIAEALVIFPTIYWGWVSATVYTNQRDVNNPLDIVSVFALGLISLVIALAVPGAYDDRGPLFGGAYLLLRVLVELLALKNLPEWRKIRLATFNVGPFVTGPLLFIGGLAGGLTRLILWTLAALADAVGPFVLRRPLARVQLIPWHYLDRFGLFLIIALGESLVQMSLVASRYPLDPQRLAAVAAAYTLVCSLWWLYFRFAIRAFRQAVTRAENQAEIRRSVLLYGHLLFLSGAVAVSIGLAEAVTAPSRPLPGYAANLLTGGCALYLGVFEYTRWRISRTISWQRLGSVAACLAVRPLAPVLPALGAVLVLTGVLITINVAENRIVRRTGLRRLWYVDTNRRPDAGPQPPERGEAEQPDAGRDTGPAVGE